MRSTISILCIVACTLVAPWCVSGGQQPFSKSPPSLKTWTRSILTAAATLPASVFINVQAMTPVHAQSVDWTDRNRLAAETWRAVDESFYDRTFNGQDWFALRQSIVQKNYKSDEEVFIAVKGMLEKLGDKYTRFLVPSQYSVLVNSALGELTGIGVELLQTDDGKVKIQNIQLDSPAIDSGLKTGDIIVNVDGTDTSAVTPEETAALLRGKENTKATLTVVRGTESLNFAAVRKPIKLKGVESYVKEVNGKKTGIVRIKQFSSTTRDDVMHAMEDFHKDFDRPKVLVVDMRNNAGGLLQGAVETANLFLPPGKIVTYVVEKDGLPKAQQTLPNGVPSADPDLPDQRTPLYLLVNGNTASAAEVLSAALMENDRAILVGQKTFGKGVIQNLQGLRQGGVAITIAKYETPNHNNINKIGIPVSKEIADCEPTTAADVCMAQVL